LLDHPTSARSKGSFPFNQVVFPIQEQSVLTFLAVLAVLAVAIGFLLGFFHCCSLIN
jgi:hypothetical protein